MEFLGFLAFLIGLIALVWLSIRAEKSQRIRNPAFPEEVCVKCGGKGLLQRYEWSAYRSENVDENVNTGSVALYRSTVHGATDFVDYLCDGCVSVANRPIHSSNVKAGGRLMLIAFAMVLVVAFLSLVVPHRPPMTYIGGVAVFAAFFTFMTGVMRLFGERTDLLSESNTKNMAYQVIWEVRKPELQELGYVGYKPFPTSHY